MGKGSIYSAADGLRKKEYDDDGSIGHNGTEYGYDDWGKGYTVEGMKALMNHAVRVYGARSFEGECAKDNVGSARVMQKLGMVSDHVSSYSKSDGSATFESEIYRITVDENGL